MCVSERQKCLHPFAYTCNNIEIQNQNSTHGYWYNVDPIYIKCVICSTFFGWQHRFSAKIRVWCVSHLTQSQNVWRIDRKLSIVGTIYKFYSVQLSDELTIRMAGSSANISIHLNIFIKELLTTIQKSNGNIGNSTFIVTAKVKSIIFENSYKPCKINSN